jgi:hypothetical protein
MAYDRRLADRIRAALAGRAVREAGMFGGLTFMVNDKIAVAADRLGADESLTPWIREALDYSDRQARRG